MSSLDTPGTSCSGSSMVADDHRLATTVPTSRRFPDSTQCCQCAELVHRRSRPSPSVHPATFAHWRSDTPPPPRSARPVGEVAPHFLPHGATYLLRQCCECLASGSPAAFKGAVIDIE